MFRNNGAATWQKDSIWLGAVTEDGQNLLYDPDTWRAFDVVALLDSDVGPGETATFGWVVRSPEEGKTVSQTFRLMDPTGQWLRCPTPEMTVTVQGMSRKIDDETATAPKKRPEGDGVASACSCRSVGSVAGSYQGTLWTIVLATGAAATVARRRKNVANKGGTPKELSPGITEWHLE